MTIKKDTVEEIYQMLEYGRAYCDAAAKIRKVAPYGVNLCGDKVNSLQASALVDYERYKERASAIWDFYGVDVIKLWQLHGAEYDAMTDSISDDLARRWIKECRV